MPPPLPCDAAAADVVRLSASAARAKLAAMRTYGTQFPTLDRGPLGRLSDPRVHGFEVFWTASPGALVAWEAAGRRPSRAPGWLGTRSTADVCLVREPKTQFNDRSTLVKIAEYMAISCPIVSYDLTESRLTVGEASVHYPQNAPVLFARVIAELLDDHDRRAEMGAVGRARVARSLSWECSDRGLLAAYEAVLSR